MALSGPQLVFHRVFGFLGSQLRWEFNRKWGSRIIIFAALLFLERTRVFSVVYSMDIFSTLSLHSPTPRKKTEIKPSHQPFVPSIKFVVNYFSYNIPFRARSTFRFVAPLILLLLTHIARPSGSNSYFSSTSGQGQGQWVGLSTQDKVPGHR